MNAKKAKKLRREVKAMEKANMYFGTIAGPIMSADPAKIRYKALKKREGK